MRKLETFIGGAQEVDKEVEQFKSKEGINVLDVRVSCSNTFGTVSYFSLVVVAVIYEE